MKYILAIAILLVFWQTFSLYLKTGRFFFFRRRQNRGTNPVLKIPDNEFVHEDLIGSSRFRLRQNMNTDDNTRLGVESVVHHRENDSIFGSELQNSGVKTVESENRIPGTFFRKEDIYNEWIKRKTRQVDIEDSSLASEPEIISTDDSEIPERYQTIGYVEKDDPNKAEGVTFESLDIVDRVMEGGDITNDEQKVAVETLERLRGTDMGKLLESTIAGSNKRVKRFINIFVDAGYKIEESQEPTSEDILSRYRLDDILEKKFNH